MLLCRRNTKISTTFRYTTFFLYNKTNQMRQFPKFTPAWNSTCFGQFLCPSSGVYSLYTQQWFMSYRFVDSFRAGPGWSCSKAVYKPVWHSTVPSVQWINSWWGVEELPETCRVSCRSKFGKSVHLFGFIIKKFVTLHGHINEKKSYSLFNNFKLKYFHDCFYAHPVNSMGSHNV